MSPFIGRLDDHGENGIEVIKKIQKMYINGDGHVHILAASMGHGPFCGRERQREPAGEIPSGSEGPLPE